ncbi:MAG: ferredoxin reductase family protein [Actinobacteria bacterium]|nr:ferredoxin reductase family protein [Actinomycetota bacterium]
MLAVLVVGNAAAIVWLWWHGGNVTKVHSQGEFLTSIARITGLLGAYLALLQVLLLARLRPLERLVGFDRLTVWHRWNGHACLYLILAHVFFSIWGYADMDRITVGKEIPTMIWHGHYPGMIVATVGTFLFVAVVFSSIVVVRRRLDYRWWYALHFTAYAAIALGWFHQIPTGNELVLDTTAQYYWESLYLATLAVLIVFRVVVPAANAFRYRLRVAEVREEGAGVVSLRITGKRLERLHAAGGQFFLWRFLTRHSWYEAHPFSLSAAPTPDALRLTVKGLGDFTGSVGRLRPGTRVIAEGPFGVFTAAARRREKVLLIAGGIGVTPIRALLDEMDGDIVVVYRVLRESDAILRDELTATGAELHVVAGDHAVEEGRNLLSPEHLRQLVPDVSEREIYLCGPPAMTSAIERTVRALHVPRKYVHVERFAF